MLDYLLKQIYDEDMEFYAVSPKKFIILSITTFGLFEFYWFYKNWQAIKRHNGSKISPFWRSVFIFFTCNQLFKEILHSAKINGYAEKYSPGWITFFYIALAILWRLPDPWWIISTFSFVPLLSVQRAINFNNSKVNPNYIKNNKFSGRVIMVIAIGGALLFLVLMGTVGL